MGVGRIEAGRVGSLLPMSRPVVSTRFARLVVGLVSAVVVLSACSDSDEAGGGIASCDLDADGFVTGLFGASADEVIGCLGEPDERFDTGSGAVLAFPDDGLEVGTNDGGVNMVIAYGEVAAGTDRPDYNSPFAGQLPDGALLTWDLGDFVGLYGDPVETRELLPPVLEVGARYETFLADGYEVEITRDIDFGQISSILYRPS